MLHYQGGPSADHDHHDGTAHHHDDRHSGAEGGRWAPVVAAAPAPAPTVAPAPARVLPRTGPHDRLLLAGGGSMLALGGLAVAGGARRSRSTLR